MFRQIAQSVTVIWGSVRDNVENVGERKQLEIHILCKELGYIKF